MRNAHVDDSLYGIQKLEAQAMRTISVVAKRFAPEIMVSICQAMTQGQAYRLGDWLASLAVRYVPLLPLGLMRSNLSVVMGVAEYDSRIDAALLRFVKNLYCSYVDFFKALRGGKEKIVESIDFPLAQRKKISDLIARGQSVVLVGPHCCGFDFGIIALTDWFPEVQLLSKPDPRGEYKFMHQLRLRFGLNMTPISGGSLRQAVRRLKEGGLIVIANDLPVSNGSTFKLFGKEARLTTGHARLALTSDAVMMMVLTHRVSPGRYQVTLEEIPRPEPTGDREADAMRWAGKSYDCLEKYVRQWPEEWYGLMMNFFED